MGGVGPASGCCCHGGGRGSAGGCLSPSWRYRGPLHVLNATVPGQLGCGEVGSLPTSQPGAGAVCLSGRPPLPPLFAELTTVWGTSEDPGCHAPGQESHTEGGSVGQPVPAPFPSPPRGLPPLHHQFTSKTVRAPASFPPLHCYGEGSRAGGVGLGGAKLSSIPPHLSSACTGDGWRWWGLV